MSTLSLIMIILATIILASCGGSNESGLSLDRQFGIKGSTACEELNEFFPVAMQTHLTVNPNSGFEVYKNTLSETVSDWGARPTDDSRRAYNVELEQFRSNLLNQVTSENWASHLSTCSDLQQLQNFVSAASSAHNMKFETPQLQVFRDFLNFMPRQLDNMSSYDDEDSPIAKITPPKLTELTYNFGLRLDLGRESYMHKRSGSVRVFSARPETTLKSGDEILWIEHTDSSRVKGVDNILQSSEFNPLVFLKDLFYSNVKSKLALKVIKSGTEHEEDVVLEGEDSEDGVSKVDAHAIGSVAYIRFEDFMGTKVAREFASELATLASSMGKVDGIVLDLRYNSGGFLSQMQAIANLFLSPGTVGTFQTNAWTKEFKMRDAGIYLTQPLVILVNQRSCSSSEVLTQLLQESGRAVVVGTQTFGKFIMQDFYNFAVIGGTFALTTQRFYGPSGRNLSAMGITPDVQVVDPEFEALKEKCVPSKDCTVSVKDARAKNFVPQSKEVMKAYESITPKAAKLEITPELLATIAKIDLATSKDPQLDAALKILGVH